MPLFNEQRYIPPIQVVDEECLIAVLKNLIQFLTPQLAESPQRRSALFNERLEEISLEQALISIQGFDEPIIYMSNSQSEEGTALNYTALRKQVLNWDLGRNETCRSCRNATTKYEEAKDEIRDVCTTGEYKRHECKDYKAIRMNKKGKPARSFEEIVKLALSKP